MASLEELIAQASAFQEKATELAGKAEAVARESEETRIQLALAAGQFLSGSASEAYAMLSRCTDESRAAAGAAAGAADKLGDWINSLASGG